MSSECDCEFCKDEDSLDPSDTCHHKWVYVSRFSLRLHFKRRKLLNKIEEFQHDQEDTLLSAVEQQIMTKWQLRCRRNSGKKKMLVLCHGRHHQRILSQWRDEYNMVYVDEDAKCKPHLVLNILSQ